LEDLEEGFSILSADTVGYYLFMDFRKTLFALLSATVYSGFAFLPAQAAPASPPVAITVDWKRGVASATPRSYGLNAFSGFDPAITTNPTYQANLRFMAPGLLRLHNWGMMGDSGKDSSGWIDTTHQRWDAAKIKAALAGFSLYQPLLINIPGWPKWLDKDKDGFLDSDQTEAYAQFCAQLVQIVNHDLKKRVVYWEVTNEQDGRYFVDLHTNGSWGPLKDAARPDRVEELANIYNRCAAAMKAVDPMIQVGGPAIERPDLTEFVRRFARVAGRHLDFFSYHAYASGSAADMDDAVFDRAVGFGEAAQVIVETLRAESPSHPIPLFFDEFNISWTWETRDSRMTSVKGAVFDALAITSAVTHGTAVTAAWNECDGIYGKMDNDYHLRPSATLYHWLNTDFVGKVASVISTDPKSVAAYAVLTSAGWKSLLLINRSAQDQQITLSGWPGSRVTVQCLASSGITRPTVSRLPSSLPADSLTLLTSP
jgi:hypothetical protein